MTEKNIDHEEHHIKEKLESVGQIIIGELEKIGGILTADPISQAEGELTEEAGSIHLETAENLDEEDQQTNQNQ